MLASVRVASCLVVAIIVGLLTPSAVLGAQPVACGTEWINLHKKNPDLLGVYVQQLPDNVADEAAYRGRHPSMIIYLFKGGRVHQVSYTPSGQVEDGFWWTATSTDDIHKRISKNLKQDVFCHFAVSK